MVGRALSSDFFGRYARPGCVFTFLSFLFVLFFFHFLGQGFPLSAHAIQSTFSVVRVKPWPREEYYEIGKINRNRKLTTISVKEPDNKINTLILLAGALAGFFVSFISVNRPTLSFSSSFFYFYFPRLLPSIGITLNPII